MEVKQYAAITDQGPYLQVNEDDYEVDLLSGIFMLFDGFGGSGRGDKVVKKLKESIKLFYSKVVADPESTLPFYFSHKYLLEGNSLLNAMHYSHKLICIDNSKAEMCDRGGASGLIAAISDNILTIASTGNCRIYLNRKGESVKLLHEDCLRYVSEDDKTIPLRTSPLSGFGLFDDLHVQTRELRIESGDVIAMFTEGAYSRISDLEFAHILNPANAKLNEKIKNIFDLSNSRGNLKNQSALIVHF